MSRAQRRGHRPAHPPTTTPRRGRRTIAGTAAAVLCAGVLPVVAAGPAHAIEGFQLNNSDLAFILTQIQIAERHAATPADPADPCAGLIGPDADQIPGQGNGLTLPFGLRTVDGTCNNLLAGQSGYGAADQVFPRRAPEADRPLYTGTGNVTDAQPRVISNLIVDQTSTNPAAVDAWLANQDPDTPVPENETLFVPNTAPDVGLSSPYNSMFTLFGQFFDHGLDLVPKTGSTVFVPLQPGDPLFVPGAPTNFMVLTRATTEDGDPVNSTSPFVDQSQTYTSHPAHQVFLREYDTGPVSSGRILTGPQDGLADWDAVQAQAAAELGILLSDQDALSVPLVATDPYGRFLPGPNGLPQLVVADPAAPNGQRLVEGDLTTPVPTTGAVPTGHAFLDDIAHHAVPFGDHDRNPGTPPQALTPDGDTDSTLPDASPATYDDEMLGAHFIAGDGRINENIGLTAVHHVFHSEHNRLREEIDAMVQALPADRQAAWELQNAASGYGYGERLFQAARFVTEMEYQHLAFEEFARKVQPQVNIFTGYDTGIDPAIPAEFAHAVYRFGHSMLTEEVARIGNQSSLPLLDAFLNPPRFYEGGATPEQAVGNIARGMTDQVGNELDEFVTEALRNRLLGLPLDLATLNLARGRETRIPPLNEARAAFSAATNGNSALAPYTNWIDFGMGLRHRNTSLVNFVAAYGTHATITAATTPTEKRLAAARLVAADPLDPATPPDAVDFMNGTGAYAAGLGGLDDVDLWIGGLAEKQSPFGGLLGSSFNYVFETTMEDLQDGDRFYYLGRTAGLNLLVQLEGNSFAELISRNSDAQNLPADVFASLDMTFDLTPGAAISASGAVQDDPATPWVETQHLVRMSDGTIRFTGTEHVMFIGTQAADRARANEGDDTLRGNGGADRLEGEAGNDQFLGGAGNDVMTDTFGDDTLKGGDGNDALSSGPGFDLNQGQLGDDFVIGGSDPTETFGGPGDDVIYGGQAADTVFGDDGDDWIEGGPQADLLQGDNGAPFQDDPNTPGHDVIIGDGGNDDYDSEGGNDVMVAGDGIERNEGMLGFDWLTHFGDVSGTTGTPTPANDDMNLTGLLPPSVDANRDRFDQVEGISGWDANDTLRGDDAVAADMVGHELDAAGIAMITGLAGLLPTGATSFTGGNLMLGGAGNDVLEGRGGDDLIDGDAWLRVQLQAGSAPPVDGLADLQAAVFAGTLDPGTISIVRSIVTPAVGGNDLALFNGPPAEYTITAGPDGLTVAHTGGTQEDGVDTLRNVERLRFSDGTVVQLPAVTARSPLADATGVATNANVTATFNAAVVGVTNATFTLTPAAGGEAIAAPAPTATTLANGQQRYTLNPTPLLAPNTEYRVTLTGGADAIRNAAGVPLATTTWTFRTVGDSLAPSVTARTPLAGTTGVARGANVVVTFSEVVQGVTTAPVAGATFTVAPVAGGPAVPAVLTPVTLANGQQRYTLNPDATLAPNTQYRVTVTGGAEAIRDQAGNPLAATPPWTFTTRS